MAATAARFTRAHVKKFAPCVRKIPTCMASYTSSSTMAQRRDANALNASSCEKNTTYAMERSACSSNQPTRATEPGMSCQTRCRFTTPA